MMLGHGNGCVPARDLAMRLAKLVSHRVPLDDEALGARGPWVTVMAGCRSVCLEDEALGARSPSWLVPTELVLKTRPSVPAPPA
jgi:hypothetical protein